MFGWMMNRFLRPEYGVLGNSEVLKTHVNLYNIMKSIADFGKDYRDFVNIKDLAKATHSKIFIGNYPLSQNVSRETFEVDILNHFMHRQIEAETVVHFQIMLDNKLCEIMPRYNLLFDLYAKGIDLYSNKVNKGFSETRENTGGYEKNNTGGYNNSQTTSDTKTTTGEYQDIDDRRNSDTPQNRLSEVQNGTYLSEYNYDTKTGDNTVNDTSRGTAIGTNTHTDKNTDSHNDLDVIYHMEDTLDNTNLIEKLKFTEEVQSVMTQIYRDLDCLFLGVM